MFDRLIKKLAGILPESIQKLYYRYEGAILYIFFGALTTAVSIGTQYLAVWLGAGTKLSTTVSWVCAVTFAFFTNKLWVFRSKGMEARLVLREAAQFYGARLASYFLELAFMVVTVDVLMYSAYIMKLIAQVFVLVINYILSRFVIFRKKETPEEDGKKSDRS